MHFDALVKRAEHLCNWSLRTQAQLDSLTADKRSIYFTYQPSGDSYPNRQDAAKFFRAPSATGGASIPTKQQVRMPVPRVTSGSIISTWDWDWDGVSNESWRRSPLEGVFRENWRQPCVVDLDEQSWAFQEFIQSR